MTKDQVVLAATAVIAFLAGLGCWYAIWRRLPWIVLPFQRCRAVPWGSGFCLFSFALFWVLPGLVVAPFVSKESTRIERMPSILLAMLLCFPVQLTVLVLTMRGMFGTRLPLGTFSVRAICRDAGVGCAGWLAATPAVLLIHGAVRAISHWLGAPQTQNALIEVLQKQPSAWLWVLVSIEAVLLAPMREELFFRGCMQPWLANRRWGGDLAVGLALVAPAMFAGDAMPVAQILGCSAFVGISGLLCWMLTPASSSQRRHRAIIGTSLLFAATHASSWPDPIPLFALGTVLGWLGWRTQGVVAPIVCHSLFNATMLVSLRFIQLAV
jgi:membrane protease YdiL (CAAX protease family)